MKLKLLYPVNNNPFMLNQAWGIFNPAYLPFGFDFHNGIDLPMPFDSSIWCPVRAKVDSVGFNSGAGNFVQCVTTEKWEVGGVPCYVAFVFMHNKEVLVKTGDIVEVGTKLAIPDSTGFSTGNHIHFGCYRLNDDFSKMDSNDANGSFDPFPYFTGDYARLNSLQQKVVVLLTKLLKNLLK